MRLVELARVAAFAVAIAACASSGSSDRPRRGSPDEITREEIAVTSATNAYELINRLRPNWLRAPNTGSISGVRSQLTLVYLDRHRLGDLQSLRTLNTSEIQSMVWLDAAKAATVLTEIGSEPIRGAIVIKTR